MSEDTITRIDPETGQREAWQSTPSGGQWIDVGSRPLDMVVRADDPDALVGSRSSLIDVAATAALSGEANPSKDSVSAWDRAMGFNLRLLIPMALTIILAMVATLAWSVALKQLGTPVLLPFLLDRLFVFLAVLGGMGFFVWASANKQEYRHSQAGIRHKQISSMERMHQRQLEHERKLKREALAAVLQLEEQDHGGND